MCVVCLVQKQRKSSKKNGMTRQNAMKCVHFFRGWSITATIIIIITIIVRTKPINIRGKCSWWFFNSQRNSIIIVFNMFLSNNSSFHSIVRRFRPVCVCVCMVCFHWFHDFESLNWASPLQKNDCAECAQTHSKTHWNKNKRLLFFCVHRIYVCKCEQNHLKLFSYSLDHLFGNHRWVSVSCFCFSVRMLFSFLLFIKITTTSFVAIFNTICTFAQECYRPVQSNNLCPFEDESIA